MLEANMVFNSSFVALTSPSSTSLVSWYKLQLTFTPNVHSLKSFFFFYTVFVIAKGENQQIEKKMYRFTSNVTT